MLWIVWQVSLTDFTTYLPVEALVKLTDYYLRSMKILKMPLTQKSPGIRTKRPEQEQNLKAKKGAISQPWRIKNLYRRSFFVSRVEFLMKTESGYLRDTGVTWFTLANP